MASLSYDTITIILINSATNIYIPDLRSVTSKFGFFRILRDNRDTESINCKPDLLNEQCP